MGQEPPKRKYEPLLPPVWIVASNNIYNFKLISA